MSGRMRRQDRELDGPEALGDVLQRAQVLHLAMCDGGVPYVLPLSFGYEPGPHGGPVGGVLYVHCATRGRKLEVLAADPRVSFCVETDVVVVGGQRPCDWTARYRSVVGTGTVTFVEDAAEQLKALSLVVGHYSGTVPVVPEDSRTGVVILRVEIASATGKGSSGD
jgi:uncharacterized protein